MLVDGTRNMFFRCSVLLLVILQISSKCLGVPLPEDQVDSSVSKRTLEDGSSSLAAAFNPYLTPYGIYPGIKPLRPILPPSFFLNRFATVPPPPVDPVASFFKTKKDEFLNKLFNDISMVTESPSLEVRSIVDPLLPEAEEETTPEPVSLTTTPKPKVDPSVFISKKFDFLSQLFKAINTTTITPPTVDPLDPTATTVKPTIVPPGFWVPFPLLPKPPKPTKPPKPEKTKTLLLNAIDAAILKSVLSGVDPTNPALDSGKAAREVTFLDKFLHRVTDAPPTEVLPTDSAVIETRSVFPPGYWIPPYIYAAKMGIYLDKMFDTLDTAAVNDETSIADKRSAGDPSNLILDELTALKNQMAIAYAEGIKSSSKVLPFSAKPTPKGIKKPFWGPKTTPVPDATQEKLDILSDIYDKLTVVEQKLLNGTIPLGSQLVATTPATSYWAPDPTAADISEYYKTKTQDFLTQIFANKPPADGA